MKEKFIQILAWWSVIWNKIPRWIRTLITVGAAAGFTWYLNDGKDTSALYDAVKTAIIAALLKMINPGDLDFGFKVDPERVIRPPDEIEAPAILPPEVDETEAAMNEVIAEAGQ
jgi:hypothetical protein